MQELVLSPSSPLREYFPVKFNVDLCGQRKTWKGIVLIPFIDAALMGQVLENTDLELTAEEIERNRVGRTRIYTKSDGFGPQFWGSLEMINGSEFFFEYPIVSKEQDLAFMLLGAKPPPNAIGTGGPLDNKQKLFPVQIPGYPPRETPDYRAKMARPKKAGAAAFLF
jgi:hypothetical protein